MARKPDPTGVHSAGTAHSDLESALACLEHWLLRHRRRYAKGLLSGADAKQLDDMQKALQLPLPTDLRAILTWHNGQSEDFVGHFENNWDLLSTDGIVEAKRDLDKDSAETGWQPAWIPVFETDAGDYLFLDTSQAGISVRAFYLGAAEHPNVAPSLAAWVSGFVTAVEQGHYHEDPERGTFLRD